MGRLYSAIKLYCAVITCRESHTHSCGDMHIKNMSIHTRTNHRVCGEVRRSLSLRAGAMSCQMGLAPRQLMSQWSLWSPSRAPWFTCLGCQVLPSPSLMQHGCPLNLFVSVPVAGLPWLWPSTGQWSRGGTHVHAGQAHACICAHKADMHKDSRYPCKCARPKQPCSTPIPTYHKPKRSHLLYVHSTFLRSYSC